jgi:ABC-type nitrate/sulfonate/bicarbonate transport system ATPase subunit
MHLEVDNLALRYPGSASPVFESLSFSLIQPGFNALFGPSGVGKTTLARIITGDIRQGAGKIQSGGTHIYLYSYNLERLPGWSSVGRHLQRMTPAGREELREALVAAFGIQEVLDQRFSQLSLGQRNRVNLLRYLLQDFDLLIMDESLANVDELTREKIILKIKAIFPDSHFLYISHNVVEVSKFCDQIVVLRGPERKPPSRTVQGQDLRIDQEVDRNKLDQTMLEIVNASS